MTSLPETVVSDLLPEISVAGRSFERGRQYGSAAGPDIRRCLQEGVARLEWVLGRPVDRSRLWECIRRYASIIEHHLPDVADEIHGLAEGACITVENAYLLQCRREVMEEVCASDCTTIALAGTNSCIAQTIDLPGRLADLAIVLRSRVGARTMLQLTFAGLLGYVGVNDRGLAVGLNMVMGGEWRPGIPPYLLVRRLLELDSTKDCIEELRRLPRASSRCYTIVDASGACQLETTPDQIVVLNGTELLHTNHYTSAEIVDRSHVLHRRESRRRCEHMRQEFERHWKPDSDGEAQAAQLFAMLSCHGDAAICIHAGGDPRRAETVAAVVLQSAQRRMFARRGNPCGSLTQKFLIEREMA